MKLVLQIVIISMLSLTVSRADLLTTFVGQANGNGGVTPTCSGVLDLSVGCILPGLGP